MLVSDVAGLPGCVNGCKTATASAAGPAAASSAASAAAGVAPANGSEDLSPLEPGEGQRRQRHLTQVTLVDDYGNTVDGVLSPDRTSWQPTQPLKYSRTYTMKAASLGASGCRWSDHHLRDSDPEQCHPGLPRDPGGLPIHEDLKYGVGTIIAARFDEPIADKAAAERTLRVTTNPPIKGSWYWVDDVTAHWRPERYYALHHGDGGGQHLRAATR